MRPQQLRNSILQLAIEGKLVEQRPEEGTGEELYQLIQEKKQELIKAGKIKKQKEFSKITKDELPFAIPKTWRWCKLSDLCMVLNGDRGKNYPAKATLSHSGIPFISALNIKNKTISSDENLLCMTSQQYDNLRSGKLEKGDIVFCIRGSLGKYGYYPFEKGAIASSLVILRAFSSCKAFIDYLMVYLETPLLFAEIKKYDNGTAQPNLSAKNLEKFLIPLPPVEEQKRIVDKLKTIFLLVNKYKHKWERLEELNKLFPASMQVSILQEAIQGKLVEQRSNEGTGEELYQVIKEWKKELCKSGKLKKEKEHPPIVADEIPFAIPKTWTWVRLAEIGDWRAGATPPRTNPNYYGGEIPWLKTGDLTDGDIREVSEYITDLALKGTSVRLNPEGSVLMAMYGATIGKLGILTKPMTTNQACCACIVSPYLFNKYLFFFLMSNRKEFIKKGEGGAQPNISRTKIIETCMPLPPIKEQCRIVKKLEAISLLINEHQKLFRKI